MTTQITKHESYTRRIDSPKMRGALARVLPKHLTPERYVRLLLDIAVESPKVLDCTPASTITAILKCAELGLEPGSALGHVYLIPYKNVLTPVIGYKGYAELALRSGRVKRINAAAFYRAELEAGAVRITQEPPSVDHGWTPDLEKRPEDLAGAYAVAELTTGGLAVVVLDRAEIEARRPSGWDRRSDSPWKSHTEAMWRKTAMRALLGSGKVPLSPALQHALTMADPTDEPADFGGMPFDPVDVEAIGAEVLEPDEVTP